MSIPAFASAVEMARDLRSCQISSVELLEHLLDRINKYNPPLNALVTIDAEAARQRAREADQALARGEVWGPLHGLPVTVKDVFETRGLRSTAGYLPLAENIPQQDAAAVVRLRDAGAIILGKSNTPPIASDFQTDNPIFGRTNNPWDPTRTSGGSSGGGAAAVAAGLSYLDLCSDLSGSIRIPAHFCGVYGFIPTDGRVPRDGHLPRQSPGNTVGRLLRVGLLARSVDDLRLALPVIAGPSMLEPDVPPVPLSAPPPSGLTGLRIAWTVDVDGTPVCASIRSALEAFAQRLAAAGCHVERVSPAGFDFPLARQVHNRIFLTTLAAQLPALPRFIARTLGGMQAFDLNLPKYLKAETQRAALSAEMEAFLGQWDAWICPVTSTPAFLHHAPSGYFGPTPYYKKPIEVDGRPLDYYAATSNFTIPFNVTGHPVVVIPIDQTPQGLPIGAQIVGRRWSDPALLETAACLAEVVGGWNPPPGYA